MNARVLGLVLAAVGLERVAVPTTYTLVPASETCQELTYTELWSI